MLNGAAEAAVNGDPHGQGPWDAEPSPGATTRPARILIVDDERQDRQLLEVMLVPEGYEILTAASGEECLATLGNELPDLVLLDVMMPEVDGYQIASRIKANFATRNIPVVMITALGDHDARILGLNAGAVDFLTKPIDRAELCARVKNLLRLKEYGDYYDQYSRRLEVEVGSRLVDLYHERDLAQRCLDVADVILLALDANGRVTLINRCACMLLGWAEAELMGRDWIETCVPARIRDATAAKFVNLIAGDLSIVENLIVTRAGEERVIEWRNTVLRDDAGCLLGTFSSGTDITERKNALEALGLAEERMRFALQNANVGTWDMDCATQAVRWSDVLEAQYGVERGTFGGTFAAFAERIHPDDRAAVFDTIGNAMKSGAMFAVQNRVLLPDGTVRWLRGVGRYQLDAQGTATRGVGISQDITERRALEQRDQQSQKMEAMGRLASGVAHDFNNLLTVILGYAGFLTEDRSLIQRHGENVSEIVKAAERATGLTRQLLAFSRKQSVGSAPISINDIVVGMTGMLGRLIGGDIRIVLSLEPELPLAQGDRGQIEQVIMNLVINARDAMPEGGVVTIQTARVQPDSVASSANSIMLGHHLMLAVTDTGRGMTEETKRRIFEPFFTTKDAGNGTGLGLSTVFGIVKQAKGYLDVVSELGRGTTFTIYLPLAEKPGPLSLPLT